MSDIRLGYSKLSNSVFVGKAREDKKHPGVFVFTGKITDVTNDFIYAVIQRLGNPLIGETWETNITCGDQKWHIECRRES